MHTLTCSERHDNLDRFKHWYSSMDHDGDGTVSKKEFRKFITMLCEPDGSLPSRRQHLSCRKQQSKKLGTIEKDIDSLFDYFDVDANGEISLAECVRGLLGDLCEARRGIVQQIFFSLDVDSNGVMDADDLIALFRVPNSEELAQQANEHPDVVSGVRSPRSIVSEVITKFSLDGLPTKVTLQEWEAYHNILSASISSDALFVAIMKSAWSAILNTGRHQLHRPGRNARANSTVLQAGGPEDDLGAFKEGHGDLLADIWVKRGQERRAQGGGTLRHRSQIRFYELSASRAEAAHAAQKQRLKRWSRPHK